MTTRRSFLLLIAVVAACLPKAARTRQPGRLQKVGILSPGKQADVACTSQSQGVGPGCFLEGLRAFGYSDGRNIAFEYRFAEGDAKRLPTLAAEMVSLRPDVIFTFTTAGADAAAGATSTIPIVVGPAGESTFERLAVNFARPVGNVTGLTLNRPEQAQKCLQLLKELAPRRALGVRLPVASSSWRVAPDGGLVSLGADNATLSRRAAFYVHRILGGAKPADLPVERPTIFKLSVNRKTAAALGLTIPQSLLQRADEVIQ